VLGTGYWVLGTGYWVLGEGYNDPEPRTQNPGTITLRQPVFIVSVPKFPDQFEFAIPCPDSD
jgi:hypothetical protein